MKSFIVALGFISLPVFACKLSIPEDDIQRFLNPPVKGHYLKCEERPASKCHCVENIDPYSHDFIDGKFVYNSDKAFAKKLADDNEAKAIKDKEEKCKNFVFKGATIAALKAEMNEWKDCK